MNLYVTLKPLALLISKSCLSSSLVTHTLPPNNRMEIAQVAAQSDDSGVCNAAEESLRQLEEPQSLLSLSFELANDEKPVESRRLAGILLMNSLATHWTAADTVIKSQIKELLLTTLASSAPEATHIVAQVIGKVASIEIPLKQWPQLFKPLHSFMIQQASPVPLKLATMETLGYVWEEISREDLERDQVYSSLRALSASLSNQEEVRLAGLKALYKALHPPQAFNLDNSPEKTFFEMILPCSAYSKEVRIREAAFKCLVPIASTNYEAMLPYMNIFFEPTSDAICGDEESLALQAIEYCSSMCAAEIKRVYRPGWFFPPSPFRSWAQHVLVPILLETLLKHPDQGDAVSRASGTCLGLVARMVGDMIVPHVTSFLEGKISEPHWKSQEAAILDVRAFVKLAVLEFLLKDENKHVTNTWTLSRIFESLYGKTNNNLHKLVVVLLKAINDGVTNVAEELCGAIYKLAQQGYGQHLLASADHRDGEASKIRAAAAYDMLNLVLRCSDVDAASNIVKHLLSEIIQEIDCTMHIPMDSMDDRNKQAKLLSSLCVVFELLVHKLSGTA